MRLLIARHGATPNNAQARYTGQSDVALSALGERQAEALALALAGEHFDGIVTSDLRRARATAEAVARYHDLALQMDADLREIAMGEWEGQTYDEVMERSPELMRRWQEDAITVAPPGGETVAEFCDRLVRALDRWHVAYPKGTLLWVTHGGVIGVLLCHLLGMDLHRRWQFRRDNTAITEIEIGMRDGRHGQEPARYAIINRLNDTSHLRALELDEADGQREHSQVL
jgi:alpha-ribazole phosphatase